MLTVFKHRFIHASLRILIAQTVKVGLNNKWTNQSFTQMRCFLCIQDLLGNNFRTLAALRSITWSMTSATAPDVSYDKHGRRVSSRRRATVTCRETRVARCFGTRPILCKCRHTRDKLIIYPHSRWKGLIKYHSSTGSSVTISWWPRKNKLLTLM